jgi:PAS domain S-box-containing protein
MGLFMLFLLTLFATIKSQDKMSERDLWYRATLKSIGDAVIAFDTDSTIIYMNKVAENLTGWTVREAIGQNFGAVLNIYNEQTGEKARNPLERVLKESITETLDEPHRSKK